MKRIFATALLAGAAWAGVAGAASAQDNPWMIRARVIGVMPDEGAKLSAGGTALGGSVDISDEYVPEVDITYFFNKNIAAELIAATTQHSVKATNVSAVGGADVDLGDVWVLPPTVTLQYHFTNMGQFKPYVGAGVNFTLFYNEDEGPVADSIDYDSSVGPALQAGFDYDLDGQPGGWAFNADVKKIWINSDVTVDFTTALGATVKADADIDPVVLGLGFGYKF
ncbi:MAG: OmpW family outer membrane protein [Hyphomonas sp.]|uniref:OmpW/AlkL family protein n=1 Tax=Hyphomonas sp. TaxID=87 RepID=UPI003528A441